MLRAVKKRLYSIVERRTTQKCGAMDDPIRNDSLKSSGSVKQEANKARSSALCKFLTNSLGIKTNKDLFFAVVCILWLTGNIIEYVLRGECFNNNVLFIALMSTVVLEKATNNAFNSWLNKKLYD